MLARRVLLVLVALVAFGCAGRYRARAARGPDGRSVTRLERQAQQDMGCASPVRVVALEARVYQVDGCGQMREYAWSCPSRRCAFQPMMPAILRASQDLQCAPEQLMQQADTATHRAFFGCMRGAAYTLQCVDHGCTWARTPESVTMASPAVATVALAAPVAVGDPTLTDVAIPPPPGAPSAFDPQPAPPPTSVPAPSTVTVPAPPPSTASPTAPPSDSIVIPPPPS